MNTLLFRKHFDLIETLSEEPARKKKNTNITYGERVKVNKIISVKTELRFII